MLTGPAALYTKTSSGTRQPTRHKAPSPASSLCAVLLKVNGMLEVEKKITCLK